MTFATVKDIAGLLRATGENWHSDRAPRLGAALAYYMALSLAPTVVIMLAVAGWAFGAKAAEGRLIWQSQVLVGLEGSKVIQSMIHGAHHPDRGMAASLLGLVALFFGATAFVNELRDALNTIWKVPADRHASTLRAVFKLVRERLLSFALVLGAGLFLLASLVVNIWASVAATYLGLDTLPSPAVTQAADWGISFVVLTAFFAFIYKSVPNVSLEWGDVAVGAILTSLLFTTGKLLLGLYLSSAAFIDTYGAAASLVILLVWIYYSAQVLYLGAEFTRVYACRFGSHHAAEVRRCLADAERFFRP